MDRNGFWIDIFDGDQYRWFYIGCNPYAASSMMKSGYLDINALWIKYEDKRWFVCDAANPLSEEREVKMKAWARDHLK